MSRKDRLKGYIKGLGTGAWNAVRGTGGWVQRNTTGRRVVTLIIAIIVIFAVMWALPKGFDAIRQEQAKQNHEENHEAPETEVVPTIWGFTFKINPRAEGTVDMVSGWLYSTRTYEPRWYDPQGTPTGVDIPMLTQVTGATYDTEVSQKIPRKDVVNYIFDRNKTKCWMNNRVETPEAKRGGWNLAHQDLTIGITVEYYSAVTKKIDSSATQFCEIEAKVFYYMDADFSESGDPPQYREDYPDTYIYVPYNPRPQYNTVYLTIQGEHRKMVLYKDLVRGGTESDTGVEPLIMDLINDRNEQPVTYEYPLNLKRVGGLTGGRP